MEWLFILGFAISSSIDNFGVGISYGIRGIRIGFLSNLVIAVICLILSEAGILFGQFLTAVLPGVFPVLVGALLLSVIGIRIVLLAVPRKKRIPAVDCERGTQAKGLAGILQNPEKADFDKSGEIGLGEACILGVALAANAVTNGLGAGLLGFSPHAISITAAIGSFLTVWAGVVLGKRLATVRIGSWNMGQLGTVISGLILLVIAVNSVF